MKEEDMVMVSDDLHDIVLRYRKGEMFFVKVDNGFMPMITEEQLIQWSFLAVIYAEKPKVDIVQGFIDSINRSESCAVGSITTSGDVKIRDIANHKSVIIEKEVLEEAFKNIQGGISDI